MAQPWMERRCFEYRPFDTQHENQNFGTFTILSNTIDLKKILVEKNHETHHHSILKFVEVEAFKIAF